MKTLRTLSISILLTIFVLTSLSALAQDAPAAASAPAKLLRTQAWDKEAVGLFESLAIQEGGRIKPLKTYADVLLLKLNGRRSCRDAQEAKLDGTQWLMDCLFFPDSARQYKMFLIENSDVLVDLGLSYTKRRDRYSYDDLVAARTLLMDRARTYSSIEAPLRRLGQTQLINLATNMMDFESLTHALDVVRMRLDLRDTGPFSALAAGTGPQPVSALFPKAAEFSVALQALRQGQAQDPGHAAAMRALNPLGEAVDSASTLSFIAPPATDATSEWRSLGSLAGQLFGGQTPPADEAAVFSTFEALADAAPTPAVFTEKARALHTALAVRAQVRGEYRAIGLEVLYHKADLVYYSLCFYVLCFLGVAASWVRPKSLLLYRSDLFLLALPTVLLAIAIAMRCTIRLRPPVTTLYETILFVVWSAIVVCLFIEWIQRNKLGLSMGAILGMIGLFLANKYEVMEGEDTMPSMVAVLNTNFWLGTHVTTITIGYAAGLLAGALSHAFVFGKLFRVDKKVAGYYRPLDRVVYGVLCFSLLFSIVGTILGGIWANESWGRFWGWDPKENGALLICLWQLTILHAVRGRYIRDYGLHLASVFGAVVVAFSWFGVNQLGVGLHSYGFTSGISKALLIFYSIECVVMALGVLAWGLDRGPRAENPTEGNLA